MLLGLEPGFARGAFAEHQEAAKKVAEVGEALVVWFAQPGNRRRHGPGKYIVLRYNVKAGG